MNITGAQGMLKCLEEEGVSVIFGYPGATICPFYEALSTSNIEHVLVRQEQNAAHMASGYARSTGKPAVCVVTSGPGATNLITGIATAYMDSIPIIAITGQVPSHLLGRDVFQEVDITGAVEPFIKHSYLIKNVQDIPRIFKEAFHIASTGRPGPVLIDVPIDIQNSSFDFTGYPETVNLRGYKPSTGGNDRQIKKVAETISKAKRPLICAGGGVFSANAQDLVIKLAESANIPVVTTMMGIGSIPTPHRLYMGMVGSFGRKVPNAALDEADLLIIIGARVADRAITSPKHVERTTKTIHIDIDPAEIGKNVVATVPLVGDLGIVLTKLLAEKPVCDCEEWVTELAAAAKKEKDKVPTPHENTIGPKRFMHELGLQLKNDAYVVADVGQNQIWTAKYLPVKKGGRFLTTGGLGTMGYAIPAAVGVKKALPKKQVLAVCGDGGFQMTSNELSTIAGNGLDIKIVLLNNRVLGMVNEIQRNGKLHHFAVDLPETPDFQILAEAYGIKSRRICKDEDMAPAIKEMLSHKGPFLLECVVDPEEGTKTK